jgi:uncharacterized protein YndB with AHSA1/START domain
MTSGATSKRDDVKTADLGKIVNTHTVRFERLLPAPINSVWEHLTSSAGLGTWLCPDAQVDHRVGGRVELPFPTPDPESSRLWIIRGLVSEFAPPKTLAYSWFESSGDLSSNLRIELEPRGQETLLVLTHSRIAPEFMPRVGAGWHSHLEVLTAVLRGEKSFDHMPMYTELLPKYSVAIAAAVVFSSAVSPAVASSSDNTYKALYEQRRDLLTRYDSVWREADDLKGKMDVLKRDTHQDVGRTLDYLDKDLKQKEGELRNIEVSVRDLDRSLVN